MKNNKEDIRKIIEEIRLSRDCQGSYFKRFFLRNCLFEIEKRGGYLVFDYNNWEEFFNNEMPFLSANYLKVQNKIKDYEILLRAPIGTYSYETIKELIKYRFVYSYLRTDEEYKALGINKELGEREYACSLKNRADTIRCWHYICQRSIRFPPNSIEIKAFAEEYNILQNPDVVRLHQENQLLRERIKVLENQLRINR